MRHATGSFFEDFEMMQGVRRGHFIALVQRCTGAHLIDQPAVSYSLSDMRLKMAKAGGSKGASASKQRNLVLVVLTRGARLTALSLLAAAICWCATCLAPAVAAGLETAIRFTLNHRIDALAAPFFLAIDKGYFQAERLNVSIESADGPAESISPLTAGGYDMGVADISSLIRLRDGHPGTPIKAVFVIFDKPPYAIIARKSHGIAAPRDLEGRKLGAPAADLAFAQWPIFAKVNDVDPGKVKTENVSLPVRDPMLAAGEVDAITGSFLDSYVDLKARGVPPGDLVVLAMADYGVELYGDAVAVSTNFATAKPDAVRGFLRAYLRALKDTVRDPARAVDAVLHRNDAGNKAVEIEQLRMAIRDDIISPAVKADGYGVIEPERFGAALDQVALAYRFKAKERAAEAFDPSFLPSAAERKVSETGSP
jgi:NitT/TauT family transport system substrate-binding protein